MTAVTRRSGPEVAIADVVTFIPDGPARRHSGRSGLGVAGYAQNHRNDLIGYGSNHMGHDAEIEAHLRANHWQDQKNADQDHHPVGFQPSQRGGEHVRKQPHGDTSAVERRQWQQIEDRQNDIDDQRIFQIFSNPLRYSVRQIADKVEQQRGDHGEPS